MILSTTPSVEGRQIIEYKGIVFGEVIAGVNFIKDFAAGLTNFSEDVRQVMKMNSSAPANRL